MTEQFGMAEPQKDMHGSSLEYNPNALFDALIQQLQLKNDAALSRLLEVAPPVISKIRHHRLPVGASLLIRMHEVSGLSIRDLRYLMGDRRDKFRMSDKQFNPNNPNSTNYKKEVKSFNTGMNTPKDEPIGHNESAEMDDTVNADTTTPIHEHIKSDEPRE